MKCVLLRLLSSEPFSSVCYRAAVAPHIVILFIYTLALRSSGWYQATHHALEGIECAVTVDAARDQGTLWTATILVRGMTCTSALEPAP